MSKILGFALVVLAGANLISGCVTTSPRSYEESLKQIGLEGVWTDLNGMRTEEVDAYFRQCLAEGEIFFYTGGFANLPIGDSKDWDIMKSFKSVSLGCTGGLEQGKQFNQLMLEHLKKRENVSS